MDDNEKFEDYYEKAAFCSAECVCEYLGIPFYNDDEVDKDTFK